MGNTNILKTFLGFYLDQDKGLDAELGPSSSESGFLSVPLHLLKMKFRLLIKGTWEVFQVQLIVQKALSFFFDVIWFSGPSYTDEETEAQRGEVTCPRSHHKVSAM